MKGDIFPLLSIIIVNYNGIEWLKKCLPSVLATKYPTFEVIVVDNASSDDSVAYIKSNYPPVKLISHRENKGYSLGVNSALTLCKGALIAVLNNDIETEPEWLTALVNVITQDDRIGIVVPKKKILYDPRFLDGAGGVQNIFGYGWDRGQCELDNGSYDEMIETLHPPGAAFVVRRELVESFGFLLNPDFFYLFEDADLGLRCWLAGYKVVYVPDSVVYHARGPSVGGHSYKTTRLNYTHVLASYYEVFGLGFLAKFFPLFCAVRFSYGLVWLKVKHNPTYLLALFSAILTFFSRFSHFVTIRHIVKQRCAISSRTLLARFSNELRLPALVLPYVSAIKILLLSTKWYVKNLIQATPVDTIKELKEDRFRYIHHKPIDEICHS